MTREEAKRKIVEMYFKNTEYYGQDFESFIEYIYDDFEQQLADYKKRIDEYEEWYIHRNEAQNIQDKNTSYMLKHIEELKELEAPRSCDGCKHYDKSIFYRKGNDCRECSRYMTDYYEPKDKQ